MDEFLSKAVFTGRKHWGLLLAGTVLGAVVAALIAGFLLKERYRGTALLFLSSSRVVLSFDPRIHNLPEDRPEVGIRQKTMGALATSDEVVGKALAEVFESLSLEERNLATFRKLVTISTAGEMLIVTAETRDPHASARTANAWAAAIQDMANTRVGGRDEGPGNVTAQLDVALAEYKKVQDQLLEFSSKEDRTATLQRMIGDRTQRLNELNEVIVRMRKGIRDTETLLAELRGKDASQIPDRISQSLPLLLVRLGALESSNLGGVPIQLQLRFDDPGSPSVGGADPVKILESVVARFEEKAKAAQAVTDGGEIQSSILQMQGDLERCQGRRRELAGARDLAWEKYLTLLRRRDEIRLASESAAKVVRSVSRAQPDPSPVWPSVPGSAGLGGLAGFLLAFAYVMVLQPRTAPAWSEGRRDLSSGKEASAAEKERLTGVKVDV